MKRKKIFCTLGLLIAFLLVSGSDYSRFFQEEKRVDETVNKIYLTVTLPDSTVFNATVAEHGELIISSADQYYRFAPTIYDIRMKSVEMNVVECWNNNKRTDEFMGAIEFEVIDIISISIPFQERTTGCRDGKCCVTCNTWTACACAVEFAECSKSCCCYPCCPQVPNT